jgi:hypothetical protein
VDEKLKRSEGTAMSGELTRGERLQIMLSPEELAAVDDFRFKQRMPSRAAAVRELFRLGLEAVGIEPAEPGTKSSDYGVFSVGRGSSHSQRSSNHDQPPAGNGRNRR